MATLKLVLDKRRIKKDKTYPLIFRLTIGNKYRTIKTGISVKASEYNARHNIVKDQALNEKIEILKRKYISRLNNCILEGGPTELKYIHEKIQRDNKNENNISDFWLKEIEHLKKINRSGSARVYKESYSAISKLIDLRIKFEKIKFLDLLTLEEEFFKKGLSVNSIGVHMRTFRAICNKAIKLDIVNFEWYPFRNYTIKKERKNPRVLSMEEIKKYFALKIDIENPLFKYYHIGRIIFFLRGINIIDLIKLKSENVVDDRIIYKRSKTGKLYSIKITKEIKESLDILNNEFSLIGILKNDEDVDLDKIGQKRKLINSNLNKIGKILGLKEKLTTYVFRYTYANTAKKLGYSKDIIAEALGHEYGNSVTGIYLENFDLDIVDEMNQNIIKNVI